MRKLTKKSIVVVAAVSAVALGGGVAFAYWSSTGTGTGAATTTSGDSHLAVGQTPTINDLAPGVAPDAISGTVTNNAVNKAYVNTVTVSISSVTQAANSTGTCDATDFTLSNPVMTVAQDLPANGGSANFNGASIAFNDKQTTNQDGCKGATVNLAYATN